MIEPETKPAVEPVQLVVPGSNASIRTACYTLAYKQQATLEILVDDLEQDEITQAIAGDTFSFPHEFDLLSALARPGQRVLDLGAHIGTFSLLAATLGYEVTAVEASPRNAALLQASTTRNHLHNLQVIPVAVSDRAQRLDFIQAGPYGLVSTAFHNDPTISVPAMSVDAILAKIGWDRVDFIKMDIEGSELTAIAGMAQLLAREDAPPILYESNGHTLHYFGETPNRLMAALENYGYTCYLIKRGQLRPLRSAQQLFECTVDCLATKTPPQSLADWQVGPPLSRQESIKHILATANSPHKHIRTYIARTLPKAALHLLLNIDIMKALAMLAQDPDPDVRMSASWVPIKRGSQPMVETSKRIARWKEAVLMIAYSIRQWQIRTRRH